MDSQITPEFDNVSPEAELKHLETAMGELNDRRVTLTKKLRDLTAADTFTLEIVLKDKDGEALMLTGNNGEEYDKITYEEVTSKNLRSRLVNAGIGLMTAMPNAANLGLQYGGELNRLDVQESQYDYRKARAEGLIAERKRKEQGGV